MDSEMNSENILFFTTTHGGSNHFAICYVPCLTNFTCITIKKYILLSLRTKLLVKTSF